jgi:phosphate transport system permease protein
MLLAIPLGVGAALYLSEWPPTRCARSQTVIEILASIPSVVIGFLGWSCGARLAALTGQTSGLNAVNGPSCSRSGPAHDHQPLGGCLAQRSNSSAKPPPPRRQQWETMSRITLPPPKAASSRRSCSDSAAPSAKPCRTDGHRQRPHVPSSFLDSVRTLTATIAIELGEVPFGSTHYHGLFAVGFVLFIITFLVNLAADLVLRRQSRMHGSRKSRKGAAA